MADGASSAEDSQDDDSNLSHTHTATGHRKRLDDSDLGCTRTATGHRKRLDDSDLGCTCTATGHRKCSSSQTVAQREEQR